MYSDSRWRSGALTSAEAPPSYSPGLDVTNQDAVFLRLLVGRHDDRNRKC